MSDVYDVEQAPAEITTSDQFSEQCELGVVPDLALEMSSHNISLPPETGLSLAPLVSKPPCSRC